jgi:hypothetical protein
LNNIKIFHQNIQNLISRVVPLEIIFQEINPNIAILSEHNLKDQELNALKIEGYSINAYFCRKLENKGGGVLILSKNEIGGRHLPLPSCQLCEDKVFECCAVKYTYGSLKFILLAVYRSPGADVNEFLNRLEILVNKMLKKCKYVLVVGDININVLENSKKTKDLKSILKSTGLRYLVNFPTRYCSTTATAIDNFLTNMPKDILKIEGIITNLSDHDAQLLEIRNDEGINRGKNITVYKRKYCNENKLLFLEMISNETWINVYNAPVQEKFDQFFTIFFYYFDYCFPKVKSRVMSHKKKWIDYDLLKINEKITNLEKLYRKTKETELRACIKETKRDYNSAVNKAKLNYYGKLIAESSNISKTTWNVVNREINLKSVSEPQNISLRHDNRVIKDPFSVCQTFCNFYTNIVESRIMPDLEPIKLQQNLHSTPVTLTNKTFYPKPITCEELFQLIQGFNNKYSAGYDDIPMPIIKLSGKSILKPLSHVINSSFISGIFPERLKISKIKPLLKNNCPDQVECYRPISLTSSFSKVFEKVMAVQIVNFLENNDLMDSDQHGFRSGKSVISASIEFVESIIESLDKGEKVVGILMDLTKAFDSVCHTKLINTLSSLGIKKNTLSWFKSYLTQRKQFVEINFLNNFNQLIPHRSKLSTVKYGIPQGSILGPLLFLCYIKGLPNLINFDKMTLYADDINLKVSGRKYEEIEITSFTNLSTIQQYLADKNLLINPQKTKYIKFSMRQNKNSNNDMDILINNQILDETDKAKFLGLTIDKHLDWTYHVDHICNKLASGLFALRKLSLICDLKTLKTVYFALIHSHISFGIILYGSTSKTNLNRILVLQKRAVRIMLNLKQSDTAKPHFAELGILTVYSLYILELILWIKQNINSLSKLGENHMIGTRYRNNLSFSIHNHKIFEKKPSYAGRRYFNHLPVEIKQINDFKIFKRKLRQFMVSKPLYSLDEFFC